MLYTVMQKSRMQMYKNYFMLSTILVNLNQELPMNISEA